MFFQTIFQMMSPGVDYNLTLSRTEGKMTVLVLPKVSGLKDAAQSHLVPFSLNGTPAEIDQGFFPAIQQPVQRAGGLLTNMSQYEKQAEKAAATSKATKDGKAAAEKEAREKREKYDKHLKAASEQETSGNLDGAMTSLQQARFHAAEKDQKSVDEKIAALKARMSQGSLFDMPPAQPLPQQPAQVQQPAPPRHHNNRQHSHPCTSKCRDNPRSRCPPEDSRGSSRDFRLHRDTADNTPSSNIPKVCNRVRV